MTERSRNHGRESRRSFVKKGVLTSGAFALGLSSANTATAQQNDDQETVTALMFNDEFRPGSQLRVISPVIEQAPALEDPTEDAVRRYNQRSAQYLVTGEQITVFFATVPEVEVGQVYELQQGFSQFEATAREGLLKVKLAPVPEQDQYVVADDDNETGDDIFLKPGEDFSIIDGGGKALVRSSNFYPHALIQITSGVIEWTPRENVEGSDIFSEYNTRQAEFLNTDDEFQIHPAHAAEVAEGGVYVMKNEIDITDPEGNLVTLDINRINEDDLDEDLL